MQVAFETSGEEILLNLYSVTGDANNPPTYILKDSSGKEWMTLSLNNNEFTIVSQDSLITEDSDSIKEKLEELLLKAIEELQSGTEENETADVTDDNPYDPEKIKVNTKQFSLRLIYDLIDAGDIDLTPDFQRNFVWNGIQKSKLIESILLRIPLPMFYFSEDSEGRITVVDGLQRLTTIKDFMDNKFSLRGLEYLKDNCNGCYYSNKNKDGSLNKSSTIDAKYFRWFNMTQITVNVIDPSSPYKVKYDIFRRINTGGKPLKNQEIRNCLASKHLRKLLRELALSEEFKNATDNSIKDTRMEAQEMALRFVCFHRYYNSDSTLDQYNGNMESSLDELTEKLGHLTEQDLFVYRPLFMNAMKNAEYLFGKYAFRKIMPYHLTPHSYKQLINKALFVSWSVLLSRYNHQDIEDKNQPGALAPHLAQEISNNRNLFEYLSYGTNGKLNIQEAFKAAQRIISNHLILPQ